MDYQSHHDNTVESVGYDGRLGSEIASETRLALFRSSSPTVSLMSMFANPHIFLRLVRPPRHVTGLYAFEATTSSFDSTHRYLDVRMSMYLCTDRTGKHGVPIVQSRNQCTNLSLYPTNGLLAQCTACSSAEYSIFSLKCCSTACSIPTPSGLMCMLGSGAMSRYGQCQKKYEELHKSHN